MAISYPSDPVTAGATEIQGTVFNVVPTDYVEANANAVRLFRQSNGALRNLPEIGANGIPPNWMFFVRQDLSASASALRNLIGIKLTLETTTRTGFSATLGKNLAVPVTKYRVEVFNWYAVRIVMGDTTTITDWLCDSVSKTLPQHPETLSIETTTGAHRHFQEAAGFLFTQVAGTVPTLAGILRAVTGISPLV